MKKVISKVQFESNGFQTVFEHSFRVVVGLDILNEGIITDLGYDAICVTTNGVVKRNGELVMGAGVAKQFANKFANIQKFLVKKLNQQVITSTMLELIKHLISVVSMMYYRSQLSIITMISLI